MPTRLSSPFRLLSLPTQVQVFADPLRSLSEHEGGVSMSPRPITDPFQSTEPLHDLLGGLRVEGHWSLQVRRPNPCTFLNSFTSVKSRRGQMEAPSTPLGQRRGLETQPAPPILHLKSPY